LLGTGNENVVTSDMNQAVFTIEGMTCEGCAAIAEQAIRNVPGVLAVEVDYQSKRAVVGTDACCPVPVDEILSALKKAGYRGSFSRS
jgi:copper chaperone CopZ